MKATHRGTCQWCGRTQLLPSGVLARHGYTLGLGWQTGTCHGSGYLPYEQSCDLIVRSIQAARGELDKNAGFQDQLRATDPGDGNQAWQHVYWRSLSTRTRGAVYIWTLVTLQETDGRLFYVHDGVRVQLNGFSTMQDIIRDGLQGRLSHAVREAQEIAEYITRQEARTADWKPRPLTKVSAS